MTVRVRGQKSFARFRVFVFEAETHDRETRGEESRHLGGRHVWNGHEENATRRKRVRIARSRPRAWGGIERRSLLTRGSSGARSALPRSTREIVPRRGRRFRHAPKSSHTSHDRRTPRMGKSPHRSHEWHSSRPCKHGSNIGSRSHGRTRSRRESGGALRADEPRACVPRPGRRERLCRDQCATAHAFIVRLRSRLGQRPRTNASKRGAVHCMGKQCESCSARIFIFERTRRRSFAWKKVGVHIGVPSGDALRRAGLPTSGAGFRAFRAYAGTVRVARRSRLERTSSLRRVRGTSSTERPQGTPPPPPPRCRAPALTPCSARRRRSS